MASDEPAAVLSPQHGTAIIEATTVPPSGAWSERTNLQVQKMEATIEQDLSKAMAGIREQFRQQFDDAAAEAFTLPSRGASASQSSSPAARAPDVQVPVVDVARPHDDSTSDVQCEASSIREDGLSGLARLRRDLEAERARQSSTSRGEVVEREWQQLQVAAAEAALTDIRRDLLLQQGSVGDLRKELSSKQESLESLGQRMDRLEHTMAFTLDDLDGVRARGEEVQVIAANMGASFGTQAGEAHAATVQLVKQEIEALAGRFEHVEQFSQNVAEAAAAKLDQLEVRLVADLTKMEQSQTVSLTQTGSDVVGLRQHMEGLLAEQAARTLDLQQQLDRLRSHFTSAEAVNIEAASQGAVSSEFSEGLKPLLADLTNQLLAERSERAQDVDEIRCHFAQTLDDVREHVGKEFAFIQEVMQTLQGRIAEVHAGVPSDSSNSVGSSSNFGVLTEALKIEQEARAAEVAELRSMLQEVQVCAPTASELRGAAAGELEQALSNMHKELTEDIHVQVAASASALRGHVAVGCAELRGELTARLDVYEAHLHQNETGSTDGQGALCQRVQEIETELREVVKLMRMLMQSAEQLSFEMSSNRREDIGYLSARIEGLECKLAGSEDHIGNKEPSALQEMVTIPSLISGDLKESLEKLVAKVNINVRRHEGDEAQSQRDPPSPSAPSGRGPLLSNTSDPNISQRSYAAMSAVYGNVPHPLTFPRNGSGHVVGRLVSQPQSHRTSTARFTPERALQAFADDGQDEGNIRALREKCREALAQQQDPNALMVLGQSAAITPSGYPLPAVAGSPRRGVGSSWHSQVTAVLQGQQAPPPRVARVEGGITGPSAHASGHHAPAPQARAVDIFMANTGVPAPGSYASPAGSATTGPQNPPGPVIQRTQSPVAMHRGVSPVVLRQQAVPRAVSPIRPQQLL
jgi:hypothetical protein